MKDDSAPFVMNSRGYSTSEAAVALPANVDASKARRLETLRSLYEEYGNRIHAHAYRMLGNQQDAEDVTQETFLRAFKSLGQLRQDDRLVSWLYTIASNICLDLLRRKRRLWWLPLPEDEAGETQVAVSDNHTALEEGELVRRALKMLAPKDALCLVLRTAEGFSCAEVAEIMDCTESAVWSRLARARAAFAKAYSRVEREVEDAG